LFLTVDGEVSGFLVGAAVLKANLLVSLAFIIVGDAVDGNLVSAVGVKGATVGSLASDRLGADVVKSRDCSWYWLHDS
jgi:hypothetical protein